MAGYSVTYSVVDEATAKIDAINRRIRQLHAPLERQQRALAQFVDASGLKKVAEGFDSIARSALSAFKSIASIAPPLAAITGAASIAGVFKLVGGFADMAQTLERNADTIGTSTQRLQTMQNAARLIGADVDNLTAGLKQLSQGAYNARLGFDPLAAQTFAEAGIAINDVNGKLRDGADLFPDVVRYLYQFQNATERSAVATRLGASAIAEYVGDLKESGVSQDEAIRRAQAFRTVTDEERHALREYRMAMGGLSVAFIGLGTSIAAVLSKALTPLIRDFGNWVNTHQPQIIEGVERITAAFTDWATTGGPERLLEALKPFGEALKFIAEHAEAIAVIFAVGWGVKAVAGIWATVAAIRAAGAAAAAASAATGAGAAGAAAAGAGAAGAGGLLALLTRLGLLAGAGAGAYDLQRDIREGKPELKGGDWSKWLDLGFLGRKLFGGATPSAGAAPAPGAGAPGASRFGLPAPGAGAAGKTSWTPPAVTAQPGAASAEDPRGMIPVIRAAASAYGIDPDVAVRVAKSEGLGTFEGDKGTSFGAFQLHKGGLGTEFQKQTGLDPADPRNETAGIYWAMQNLARNGGWTPYHGAARSGIGAREGIGGGTTAPAGGGRTPGSTSAANEWLRQNAPFPTVGRQGAQPTLADIKWRTEPPPPETYAGLEGPGAPKGGPSPPPASIAKMGPPRSGTMAPPRQLAAPQAEGAPGAVAGGGKPVNGAVDVTVTGQNLPAGIAVRAAGEGSVNLAPVRTQFAEMAGP